jgi:hypothetical protein
MSPIDEGLNVLGIVLPIVTPPVAGRPNRLPSGPWTSERIPGGQSSVSIASIAAGPLDFLPLQVFSALLVRDWHEVVQCQFLLSGCRPLT